MLVIAHRGASHAEPENTPAAFRTADEQGADAVELDVRLAPPRSGSRRLVVHHDPLPASPVELDRLVGFDEVLASCGERMAVNVEIKDSTWDGGHDPSFAVVELVLAALREAGPDERWLISSFSAPTVDRVRQLAPAIRTGLLTTVPDERAVARALAGGHVALHPEVAHVDAAAVARCHDAGLDVNVWTCDDPDRLAELASIGVDGACTNVPDVALAALGRGGPPALSPRWGPRRGRRA